MAEEGGYQLYKIDRKKFQAGGKATPSWYTSEVGRCIPKDHGAEMSPGRLGERDRAASVKEI